ncbi:FmdB family zinc ribbon protein [Vampirovibrio chlorellavorus]|uniref:FmdB family zinc ribbon protein n=1 Tax=Vampirovibrio chlorellavorus TaxID=758823 RepID=UPI0026F134B2|nr:FmdB family zinc ribbon protein [Vampirovibrio chlorellavorus]
MPTNHYRCSQCQQVFTRTHGMLESLTLICEACGHFCTKVVLSAPMVMDGRATESITGAAAHPVTEGHHCGSGCVLHRRYSQGPVEGSEE